MQEVTITRPDDWHLHLRDGDAMRSVVPYSARQFHRALVMPNLRPPITTTDMALTYRKRILAAVPAGLDFQPFMTLYLTDNTMPDEIWKAQESGVILAAKLYPAGATTNSDNGVTNIGKIFDVLGAMEEAGLVLSIHGEVTDQEVDIFDREKVFIDRVLWEIAERFPKLRIVLEHITTSDAVDFVELCENNVAATITANHLLENRNAIFKGGICPHYYCLPILKQEDHRQALLQVVASGNPKFFLGTDSAPHPFQQKENACGCAGCFTAYVALELYATAFESVGALDKLEGFASFYGADFYGFRSLPRTAGTVTLVKDDQGETVPEVLEFGNSGVVPFMAGKKLFWKIAR